MATTNVRGGQILDGTVSRADLNTNGAANTCVIAKVAGTSPIAVTSTGGDAGTGDATVSLNVGVNFLFTSAQTITVNDAETGGASAASLTIAHTSSGLPANLLGSAMEWQAETSTQTGAKAQGRIACQWSNVTDANRTAFMDFQLVNNATTITSKMRLFPSGGLSVNSTTDPGAGVINANTGFKVAGAAATLGNVLTGDGTQHVSNGRASGQTASTTTAGTVSTTGVMAGLAGSITPLGTGRVLVTVYGTCQASLAATSCIIASIRYFTGTAPAHGAAPTGTIATGAGSGGQSINALANLPFSMSTVITGLTVGTAYWFDVVYASSSASSTAKMSAAVSAIEF